MENIDNLSREELVTLLLNSQKKVNELRFQVRHCNCEYSCVKCSFPNCNAIALMHGKYDDNYENCKKMIKCKCGKNFCDKHIFCQPCQACEQCSEHEKCKYCDIKICHNNENENLYSSPKIKKSLPGKCECGEELSECAIYHCKNCKEFEKNYIYSRSPMYFNCEICNVRGVNYRYVFYTCYSCDFKNENKIIPPCENCGLERHFGCKDFGLCSCEEEYLCPECNVSCKTCHSPLGAYCAANSQCVKCENLTK